MPAANLYCLTLHRFKGTVPEDATDITKYLIGEEHSHTYLSLKEVVEFDWMQTTEVEEVTYAASCMFFLAWIDELKELAKTDYDGDLEKLRLVFAFDN